MVYNSDWNPLWKVFIYFSLLFFLLKVDLFICYFYFISIVFIYAVFSLIY